ncbi:adipogenesis regulatory factor-like [Hemicordylus capensis]|uniref:adipogenesis regulatory factor-like n=1 Tax=Hemicordylus capensis TaxID=884348 RepID=UPI0023031FFD|nr:adipogenesis regulatory factor-like [Hemicordylus capensis]
MSGKGFKGLGQHAQGTVQDAANSLGQAAQQAMNQTTEAGQKVVDQACKLAQDGIDKATGQAANTVSDLEKKLGLKK